MAWLSRIFRCCKRQRRKGLPKHLRVLKHHYDDRDVKAALKIRRKKIPKRRKANDTFLKYLMNSADIKPTSGVFTSAETFEPLSFLQKMAEPFEYSYLLDMAADTDNCAKQMAYVAAFSHVCAMKIRERFSRPFPALLGETYELDYTNDAGFLFLAEQVSLAPKTAVSHCTGTGWTFQTSCEYSSQMQARFINVNPELLITVVLNNKGSQFIWPLKLNYRIYNIIFGKEYFDVFGIVEIVEKRQQDKFLCRLEYLSKTSEQQVDTHDVVGTISKNNQPVLNIRGSWERGLEIYERNANPPGWSTFWAYEPISEDREPYYYFTDFVIQLNELECCLAPTDSRLRPDIRDLENGRIKSANSHKRIPPGFSNEWNFINLPADFHEPLTMLQKLTEIFEFSVLLNAAAAAPDITKQLTYVATFAHVSYSTLYERLTKPFSPLLGETYECNRLSTFGWRSIAEQVTPSVSVVHCEGNGWICSQEFSYLITSIDDSTHILPSGYIKVKFIESNTEYRWDRNVIIIYHLPNGTLIPEIQGACNITGERKASKYSGVLQYTTRRKILDNLTPDMEGAILYKNKPLIVLRGSWRNGVTASSVKRMDKKPLNFGPIASNFQPIYQKNPIPYGREFFYNFSEFTINLNRKEFDVAPTDSRFRQDVRLLEVRSVDESEESRKSLEEKQTKRISNNWNKPLTEEYKPRWFSQNDNGEWVYNGEYWYCKDNQDWSKCPQIF